MNILKSSEIFFFHPLRKLMFKCSQLQYWGQMPGSKIPSGLNTDSDIKSKVVYDQV